MQSFNFLDAGLMQWFLSIEFLQQKYFFLVLEFEFLWA